MSWVTAVIAEIVIFVACNSNSATMLTLLSLFSYSVALGLILYILFTYYWFLWYSTQTLLLINNVWGKWLTKMWLKLKWLRMIRKVTLYNMCTAGRLGVESVEGWKLSVANGNSVAVVVVWTIIVVESRQCVVISKSCIKALFYLAHVRCRVQNGGAFGHVE